MVLTPITHYQNITGVRTEYFLPIFMKLMTVVHPRFATESSILDSVVVGGLVPFRCAIDHKVPQITHYQSQITPLSGISSFRSRHHSEATDSIASSDDSGHCKETAGETADDDGERVWVTVGGSTVDPDQLLTVSTYCISLTIFVRK